MQIQSILIFSSKSQLKNKFLPREVVKFGNEHPHFGVSLCISKPITFFCLLQTSQTHNTHFVFILRAISIGKKSREIKISESNKNWEGLKWKCQNDKFLRLEIERKWSFMASSWAMAILDCFNTYYVVNWRHWEERFYLIFIRVKFKGKIKISSVLF